MPPIRHLIKTSYLPKLFATIFDIKTLGSLVDLPRCSIFRCGRVEATFYAYRRGAASGRIRFRSVAATQCRQVAMHFRDAGASSPFDMIKTWLHSAGPISALWSERGGEVGKAHAQGARKAKAIWRTGLHDNTRTESCLTNSNPPASQRDCKSKSSKDGRSKSAATHRQRHITRDGHVGGSL